MQFSSNTSGFSVFDFLFYVIESASRDNRIGYVLSVVARAKTVVWHKPKVRGELEIDKILHIKTECLQWKI